MGIDKPTNPEGGAERAGEMKELASTFAQQFERQVDGLVARLREITGTHDSPGYEERWREMHEALHTALGDEALTRVIRAKVDAKFGSGFYEHIRMGK